MALFGDSITTDHISPAGAIKESSPAGHLAEGARRRQGRLQLLRLAPRQPRRDDARHLRQRAHQEPDDPARRERLARGRRRDAVPALGREDVHLRRGDEVHGRGHADDRLRRRGIRHRLEPRLGRQGHAAARHQGGDREELRAHPSLEPGRHGRAAAAVQAGRLVGIARHPGRRDLRRRDRAPTCGRSRTRRCIIHRRRRQARVGAADPAHRHARSRSTTTGTAASCRSCCGSCSPPRASRRAARSREPRLASTGPSRVRSIRVAGRVVVLARRRSTRAGGVADRHLEQTQSPSRPPKR